MNAALFATTAPLASSLTLAIAILAAFLAIAASIFFRAALKRQRQQRFAGLELRPNCLLTRYPMVFVCKQKTLFRVFDDWHDVPKYLREHGYEVMILTPVIGFELPSIMAALAEFPTKCHLLGTDSHASLIEQISLQNISKIASLTLVQSATCRPTARSFKVSVNELRPPKSAVEIFEIDGELGLQSRKPSSWDLEAKFLNYAISLAERDAEWCD